jgi:hypothetical protein
MIENQVLIIGLSVGSVVLLILIVLIFVCICCKKCERCFLRKQMKREDKKYEEKKSEMTAEQKRRREELNAKHDEIREKYGTNKILYLKIDCRVYYFIESYWI